MKKLNNTIKTNITTIIGVFLIISPFLDLFTSIGIKYNIDQLRVGIIIRGLFMLLMIYYSIFLKDNKKQTIIFLSVIFTYIALFLTKTILTNGNITYETTVIFKTFYFIILSITFINLEKPIDIKYYIACFTTYLLLVFIPNILNIGFNSYEIAKVGQVGWFNSANEISTILSILTPILIVYLMTKKNKILSVLYLIIILITFFSIGTKVPILSLAIICAFYFLYSLYKLIRKKDTKKIAFILSGLLIVIISTAILLPKTSFYKNIKIHLEYLEVDNIVEIFTDTELIDHFLLGSRLKLLSQNIKTYKESSTIEILLGIGAEHRQSEMDFFDIFINYGIIGFALIATILIILIIRQKPKYTTNTKLSLLLAITIAFLSGHVLVSPAVSIFIPLLLFDKSMVK